MNRRPMLAATGEAEMILGGRFLMMKQVIPDDMFASESIAILGFDRRTEEYTLLGLDTIGTYWISAQGPARDAGSAVLSGEDYDAVFGGTQEYDFVLRWEDDGTWVTELIFKDEFHTRGGGPFKMMESVARRR